jgi:hypothetical protein
VLAPGMQISGQAVFATVGAGTTPSFINQSIGFMADGSLALDTNAPAGSFYKAGLQQSDHYCAHSVTEYFAIHKERTDYASGRREFLLHLQDDEYDLVRLLEDR